MRDILYLCTLFAIMRGLNLAVLAIGLLCIKSTIAPADSLSFSFLKGNWFSRQRSNTVLTEKLVAKVNHDPNLILKKEMRPRTYPIEAFALEETNNQQPKWMIAPTVQGNKAEWDKIKHSSYARVNYILPKEPEGPTYLICTRDKPMAKNTLTRLANLPQGGWFRGPAIPKKISYGYAKTNDFVGPNNIITKLLGAGGMKHNFACLHVEYAGDEMAEHISKLNQLSQHAKQRARA
ncbi:hypothetical protein BDF22DRAFT_662794 [Syncephalis plumigaleata]|nr:hypothetical protein BDF22DRAFT_662794 [Syncephalis plumigaleata]